MLFIGLHGCYSLDAVLSTRIHVVKHKWPNEKHPWRDLNGGVQRNVHISIESMCIEDILEIYWNPQDPYYGFHRDPQDPTAELMHSECIRFSNPIIEARGLSRACGIRG